jgi:hypothetical protein
MERLEPDGRMVGGDAPCRRIRRNGGVREQETRKDYSAGKRGAPTAKAVSKRMNRLERNGGTAARVFSGIRKLHGANDTWWFLFDATRRTNAGMVSRRHTTTIGPDRTGRLARFGVVSIGGQMLQTAAWRMGCPMRGTGRYSRPDSVSSRADTRIFGSSSARTARSVWSFGDPTVAARWTDHPLVGTLDFATRRCCLCAQTARAAYVVAPE